MGKNTRILIVDDDPGMTETLADIFIEMGFGVTVAGDGYRAIEIINEQAYDFVLIDIKMPGIDGVETLEEIKRASPSTKVILMTAYALEERTQKALAEGALSIFFKPLDIDRIVGLIEKVGQGVLILAVDDDPNICETFKDILEQNSYKVSVAHSGQEAIRCAKEKAHDIVFIDIIMPDMNGVETYLAIKDINPGITAVLVTGYGPEVAELVAEATRNSAYACLHKPLDMDNVVALVARLIGLKHRGEPLGKPGDGGEWHG